MILLSTRTSSSGRSRSRSAWVYAENMPLPVLRVPLVPPRCGIWARRHHAEMTFMNELWVAVVPLPSAPKSFFMVLPKAPRSLSACFRRPWFDRHQTSDTRPHYNDEARSVYDGCGYRFHGRAARPSNPPRASDAHSGLKGG